MKYYLLYILIIFMMTQASFAQNEIPPMGDLNAIETLAESQAGVDSLPDTLDDKLIPQETATQLFAYMKWVFASSDELVGTTLAPILDDFYNLIFIIFSFVVMWLAIRLAILGWRIMLFILEWIIRLVELFPVLQ